MEKQVAATIMNLMKEITERFELAANLAMKSGEEQDIQRYKKAVGQCLGEMYFEIMSPIMDEHPDLTPPALRSPPAPNGHHQPIDENSR